MCWWTQGNESKFDHKYHRKRWSWRLGHSKYTNYHFITNPIYRHQISLISRNHSLSEVSKRLKPSARRLALSVLRRITIQNGRLLIVDVLFKSPWPATSLATRLLCLISSWLREWTRNSKSLLNGSPNTHCWTQSKWLHGKSSSVDTFCWVSFCPSVWTSATSTPQVFKEAANPKVLNTVHWWSHHSPSNQVLSEAMLMLSFTLLPT